MHSVVKWHLSFSLPLKQNFHLFVQIWDPAYLNSSALAFVLVLCSRGKKVTGSGLFLDGSKMSFSCLSLILLLRTSDSLGKAQDKRDMLAWKVSVPSHGNCLSLQCTTALQRTADTVGWVQSQGPGWMGDFHYIGQEPTLVLPASLVDTCCDLPQHVVDQAPSI